MAFGDQFSGSVRYKMSSQCCTEGICLNAFGTFPLVYLLRNLLTLHNLQKLIMNRLAVFQFHSFKERYFLSRILYGQYFSKENANTFCKRY
uniref:Uncharacterized protein n=1 Tax=Rhizophora mucronata TaxID=61149 RepID=A0A2P2MG76_RHIMU